MCTVFELYACHQRSYIPVSNLRNRQPIIDQSSNINITSNGQNWVAYRLVRRCDWGISHVTNACFFAQSRASHVLLVYLRSIQKPSELHPVSIMEPYNKAPSSQDTWRMMCHHQNFICYFLVVGLQARDCYTNVTFSAP